MTAATLTGPRSFVPPGDRDLRLAHLDPRPLRRAPVPVESAWHSAGFWVACAIVLPLAAIAAPVRALLRFL